MVDETHFDDIAIIGMSCRVAGADSPSQLWDILASSKDVRKEIDRFNSAGYYKPTGGSRKGLTNVRHAYLLDKGIDRFDNGFFATSALEAEAMDPQQRLLLEIAYEAMESAGVPLEKVRGTDTAVYAGLFTSDYGTSLLRDIDSTPKYHATGTSNSIAANRISYFFDLHGPSMVIDTACSSTMTALHQAVSGLKAKESRMALVCGANLIINPDMFVYMSELGFLSPDGRCKSFDASGDGYARGEGVLALLLKPLTSALRDGDPIRSVIKATRVNQDGKTNGITLPSAEAQRLNMEALYKSHNLYPGDIQYLEAHGTGTKVGDPLEMSAIDAIFSASHSEKPLIVGSVKSNVGHLEGCAAIVGIIKTVEALERGQIPAQKHFVNPNPNINYTSKEIPTDLKAWPPTPNGVRRAAVNSFGFGGTNGHAVFENFSSHPVPAIKANRPFLFKVSAENELSLQQQSTVYANYVEASRPTLHRLAYTLLSRRSTLKKSLFIIASTHEELLRGLTNREEGSSQIYTKGSLVSPSIGFIFTGQGAQWAGMGMQLLTTSATFARVIDQCDEHLALLPDGPSWSIRDELCKPSQVSQLSISSFSQPLCTALQLGLVALFQEWGLSPKAVLGHSSGEIGAAYVAGLVSLRDAIVIAYYRGLYMGSHASGRKSLVKGAMCAVGLGATAAQDILNLYKGSVALAAVNSPSSCTLSGDADAIGKIVEHCKEKGLFCRALRVDTAYHSHHMRPLAPLYEKSLHTAGVSMLPTSQHSGCEMFSSVIQGKLSPSECTPGYWVDNMVSTVRFTEALTEAVKCHSIGAFLEIGPHPALKGPACDTLASLGKSDIRYFASCFRNKPDLESLLETAANMVNTGIPIHTEAVNKGNLGTGGKAPPLTDVPGYQWDHSTSHWAETRISMNQRFRQFPRHQLLGARSNNDNPLSPTWINLLRRTEIDWLDTTVGIAGASLPKSSYILMTLEAAEQTRIDLKLEEAVVRIRDMHFMAELPLSLLNTDDSTVEVQFSLRSETKQHAFRFDISANLRGSGSGWKQCCVGSLDFTNADHKRIEIPDASGHEPALLDYIASLGVYPKFSFETLRLTHEKASGSFVNLVEDDEHYHLNPTIFSALERLPDALLATSGPAAEYRLESIDLIEAPLGQSSFHKAVFSARTRRTSPLRGMSDIQIHDADCWYLDIKGMTSKLFQPLDIKYPLKSLFFKPVIKPDITFLKSAASLSLQDALELVTHKWPMADLAATDLSDEELEAVQSHMQGIRDCDRPHFRSLTVLRKDDSPSIGRIRVTKAFNRDQSFHFLFGNAGSLTSNVSCVRTDGLACLKLNGDEDQDSVSRHLDIICKIEGFPSGQWLLGRPKPQQNGVNASKKLVVCASEQCDIAELQDYMDFETVRISRDKGSTCHSIRQNMPDEADVIVMDCGYESILTAWAGREVLPWTQLVLERAHNLLWVSNQIDHSPFAGVTGSFIRTIQTEYPSLKASSLVFKDSRYVSRTIFDVYDRMAHGNSETESLAQSGDICALRYRPDDELSASVGMLSPLESERGLGSSEYELSIAGVRKATLVSSRQTNRDPPDGCVKVAVEESLVDYEDVQAYIGIHRAQGDWAGLGHFFAGKVLASGDRITAPGDQVVGWQRGAHKSVMIVSASQILRAPDNMPHTKALVHFAAYAIAFDLIYDIARIRRSETMNVLVPGVLGEALNNACHLAEVDVTNDSARDAAFVVAWNSAQGLLVNGQAVPVRKSKSLASGETSALSIQSVWDCAPLQSQDHVFELRNFQGAFQNAESHPLSTVLRHGRSREVEGDWLSYVPSETLFRADAAYVVVGGLGGLGRYVLLWMISKGARHLVTLSRSGSDSEEAQRTVEAIKQLGAEIKAYKTDACDECAVNDVLAQVREDRPIRGCFNMVLVLDNAPIGTMSGQQWDKVLASKVRSTWILHRATLCDSLDMFIMFSSVSSISGNRTQANYATANSFQNSLAEYRRLQGLTGIAIALGAMRDIGVLAGDDVLLRTLSQSGLQALGPKELDKILEAAVIESHHPERHLISTGFDMFETLDGIVQSRAEQNQLFWTEWPEFGFLLEHNFSTAEVAKVVSLPAQIKDQAPEVAHRILIEAFMICLGAILGYDTASIDPSSSLASCGLDSLNAVSCRYWFFKELKIDVPLFDVLGCKSINELISRVLSKLNDLSKSATAVTMPKPVSHDHKALSVRPISHSQGRLWFLHRFLPDKTIHNLLLVCHISGSVNVKLFAEAWSFFVRRHEILHSKIVNTASGIQQIPLANPHFALTEIEATESTFDDQVKCTTENARSWIFDLEAGQLIRGWLLKSPVGWRFFLSSHHLAWDRASVPTIFDETTTIYKSLINSESAETRLKPPPYQFIDYTLWQNSWMAQSDLVKPHIDYWRSQLEGVPDALSLLPTALSSERPVQKQFGTDSVLMTLDPSITAEIKGFCKTVAVTPFMFMAAVLTGLVHRSTGDDDIVIGIADGDRGHSEFDRLVGFTVNMLAIRSQVVTDAPFADLLEDYRKTCLEAYEHRALPFDYLLRQLDIPRRTSHSPLFQISVNYQMQGAFPECDYGDFKFTDYDHYNARSQSDFMLDVEETLNGELHCVFNFDTALYDRLAMSNFADSFRVFIDNVLTSKGESKLGNISIVSAEAQSFISTTLQPDFAGAPSFEDLDGDLFPVLLSKAITSYARKPAIIDDAKIVTYAELDIATSRIASFLLDAYAKPGDRVGVCSEQGTSMVLAMYGIIRAGCVYVPIDPDFPDERIASMIEDADMETVLVDRLGDKKHEKLITCGISSLHIHVIEDLCTTVENACSPIIHDFSRLPFCCIFTSGSTGRPKGIPIGHRQLRYQMEGYHSYIGTGSEDRLLLSSAMVFDMSLPPLFGTILHGGTLIVASREARYSPAAMVNLLVEKQVSSCTFTTTQLKMLLTAPNKADLAKWTSLRSMVIGGEAIPPWVVRDFHELKLPKASIFNGYAPAETTVCNSLRRLLPEDAVRSEIPLEKPVFPSRFYILDDRLDPVPVGFRGELYIGGPTVNEGYLKREALTAEAFLRDPFASIAEIEAGHGRLYRTRDAFRLLPEGNIQSLGRIGGDRQVKIRGMRTELDEIENVIYGACQAAEDLDMCRISLAAVVYHTTGILDGVLAAYLEAHHSTEAQQRSLTSYLRIRLQASLPVHMNPSAVVFVDSLPRTVSQKIDYKIIQTWKPPVPQTVASSGHPTKSIPLNPLQLTIHSIWQSVLHLDQDLSAEDEFFALGGHSLTLIHVQDGIREKCHVTIQLGDMFANPTIEGMERLVITELSDVSGEELRGPLVNGKLTNGALNAPEHRLIDWEQETCLPRDFDSYAQLTLKNSTSTVALTGACTMAGAHFIHHVLTTTTVRIICIGTPGADKQQGTAAVLSSLEDWNLRKHLPSQSLERLTVYSGSLFHPTLGLTAQEIANLDREVDAIFQLDSDVSLLKRYENLRESNVGSLRFLISFAHGKVNNTKPIHYLSTWAVTHLQAWNGTHLSSPAWQTKEVEMTNMTPSKDGALGYLKARWACEALLYKAARRGIPVNIFRSCMCGSSPLSGVPLARTDINRRILEGSLQVGLVPDFHSSQGGGMSWITADFLVQSMLFLAERHSDPVPKARVHHLVSGEHVLYTNLAATLGVAHGGQKLRTVEPEVWFEALRSKGDPAMVMQAEVLEKWCQAGWIPFAVEAKGTLELLRREKGLVPPKMTRDLLLRLVVGEQGF